VELDYGSATGSLTYAIDDFSYGGNSLAPVPEPATMSLLGMGLFGLAARARRNKKKA
jgi:hypothetical protein